MHARDRSAKLASEVRMPAMARSSWASSATRVTPRGGELKSSSATASTSCTKRSTGRAIRFPAAQAIGMPSSTAKPRICRIRVRTASGPAASSSTGAAITKAMPPAASGTIIARQAPFPASIVPEKATGDVRQRAARAVSTGDSRRATSGSGGSGMAMSAIGSSAGCSARPSTAIWCSAIWYAVTVAAAAASRAMSE